MLMDVQTEYHISIEKKRRGYSYIYIYITLIYCLIKLLTFSQIYDKKPHVGY